MVTTLLVLGIVVAVALLAQVFGADSRPTAADPCRPDWAPLRPRC